MLVLATIRYLLCKLVIKAYSEFTSFYLVSTKHSKQAVFRLCKFTKTYFFPYALSCFSNLQATVMPNQGVLVCLKRVIGTIHTSVLNQMSVRANLELAMENVQVEDSIVLDLG